MYAVSSKVAAWRYDRLKDVSIPLFMGIKDRDGRWLGLLIGIVGVGALVGLDLGSVTALPVVEVGVVAVCYAIGPIILFRSLADVPPLGVVAGSLLLSAVAYAPFGIAQAPGSFPRASVVLSVIGLAVICTALAFVLFFELIAEAGPVRATVITYVNPAVAALLGVLVLNERFTIGMGVGFVLVLVGSVLATAGTHQPVPVEP